MDSEYITKASVIYGRNSAAKLNDYQKQMNEVSKRLCMANPDLLTNRSLLIEKCRVELHNSGYSYKKGKSRSKAFETSSSDGATPKRQKISEELRTSRISELEDRIKDLNDTLVYKEKRREKESNVHNYKECDELTQQMSQVKAERRLLEKELEQLKKKSQRSSTYLKRKKKVSKQTSCGSSSDSRSSTPLFSPRSEDKHRAKSCEDSPSISSGPVSPSNSTISPSPSPATSSGDTNPLRKSQVSLKSPSPSDTEVQLSYTTTQAAASTRESQPSHTSAVSQSGSNSPLSHTTPHSPHSSKEAVQLSSDSDDDQVFL